MATSSTIPTTDLSSLPYDERRQAERRASSRAFTRSTAVWATWTVVSRIFGLAREMLMARSFGTSAAASAMIVGQTVPLFSRSLVAEDAARGALLPVITEEILDRREEEAWSLTWLTALCTTGLMVAASVVIWFAADLFVGLIARGSAHDQALRAESERILRVLIPVVIANGVGAASSAYLVAQRRFAYAGSATAFPNLPLVVGLLAFPSVGITTAAFLVMAGALLQVLVQTVAAFVVRRQIRRESVVTRNSDTAVVRSRVRQVGYLALPVVLAIGVANFSGLIDVAFSGLVSTAGPSALDKALRLMLVPYGVIAVALGVVAMPTLVAAAVTESRDSFDHELARLCRVVLALLLPMAVVLGVFAESIVQLVYQRGAFDRQSTALTTEALRGMAFVLPAMGLSLIGARAWLARRRPWFPAGLAFVGVGMNGVLDWLLVSPFGLFGIAIATALVHLSLGTTLLLTAAQAPRHFAVRLGGFAIRIALAAGAAAAFGLAFGHFLVPPSTAFVRVVVFSCTTFLMFLTLVWFGRVAEYRELIDAFAIRRAKERA